jgi:hypothetical protein
MRKSELFDRCVYDIDKLLSEHKLQVNLPLVVCTPQIYYANHIIAGAKVCSGICVSTVEGEAGLITRAWGIVFTNPDYPLRCTEIQSSYYSESVALDKLWRELQKIKLKGLTTKFK